MPDVNANLVAIFEHSLALCDPERLTTASLEVDAHQLRVHTPALATGPTGHLGLNPGPVQWAQPLPTGQLVAACVGKAALGEARALAALLKQRLDRGIVIVPHRHATQPLPPPFTLHHAGHPVPDAQSLAAAEALLQLAGSLGRDDLLLCAISGGASALLTTPSAGLSLADCVDTTALLLQSGADIHAVNTVRKHISRIKGGRLAAACRAPILTVLLSDVAGDVLHAIGSGPTLPDPTTFIDALAVLDAHQLRNRIPVAVRRHLEAGAAGDIDETPKPETLRPTNRAVLLAGPEHLLAVATAYAEQTGLAPVPHPPPPAGTHLDVQDVAREIAALAHGAAGRQRPRLHLWVREPTVRLDTASPSGEGGRNSHLALLVAQQIRGTRATFLAAGSDGIDGNSRAAGAVVDGMSWQRAEQLGLDPGGSLRRFDSATLHRALGSAVVTGPTGTNFLDLEMLALPGGD